MYEIMFSYDCSLDRLELSFCLKNSVLENSLGSHSERVIGLNFTVETK